MVLDTSVVISPKDLVYLGDISDPGDSMHTQCPPPDGGGGGGGWHGTSKENNSACDDTSDYFVARSCE